MTTFRRLTLTVCVLVFTCKCLLTVAFTVGTAPLMAATTLNHHTTSLNVLPSSSSLLESSTTSQLHAAATIDPTAALSNLLAGFLGSPAILAIPIVAALGVASLIAFLIYAYAQPAVDNDDDM